MFAAACAIARQFTRPVVGSFRRWDEQVGAGAGTYIILNDEGWVLTVAHLFDQARKYDADASKVAAMREEIAQIEGDASLKPGYKKTQLNKLRVSADREWLTHISYWWGADNTSVQDLTVFPEGDLAVGRLEPYASDPAKSYPVIKNPDMNFGPGASLCRLEFPFHNLRPTFDPTRQAFELENAQMVFFPIEGIYTRTIDGGRTKDGKHPLLSVETSSPGLLGQSGGPVFDVHGRVWGLQSRTQHIPLGFNPKVPVEGKETVVPQFINLGVAVHSATIISVLTELGVAHQVSPD